MSMSDLIISFEDPEVGRQILLTDGLVAMVDDEDFERVSAFNWHSSSPGKSSRTLYARRSKMVNRKTERQYMHQFVMNHIHDRTEVDHKNGNGLDNRKRNLRIGTRSQNLANQGKHRRSRLTSGFKGVYLYTKKKGGYQYWRASIGIDGKSRHIGTFSTEEDAARAYDVVARETWGEFARLNFPDEV